MKDKIIVFVEHYDILKWTNGNHNKLDLLYQIDDK